MWTVVIHVHEIACIAGMFPVTWQRVCIFQRKGELHKGVAAPREKKRKIKRLNKFLKQILSMRKK